MTPPEALRVAIDLLHMPSRVRALTAQPLPDGVSSVLAIAAGDADAMTQAVVATGRPEATVRDAARFFIEQVMLAPDADSYRILGVHPSAEHAELRRHMALLSRWLHPDVGMVDRPAITGRVTRAWDDVKTSERRAAYDQRRAAMRTASRPKVARPADGNAKAGKSALNDKTRVRPAGAAAGRPPTHNVARPQPKLMAGSRLRTALRRLFGEPSA